MAIDPEILEALPLDLQIQIEERLTTKPLLQSELARQQRRLRDEYAARTKPGTRTDLRPEPPVHTTTVQVAKANRRENCTEKIAKLFRESEATVRKRIDVVEAAEESTERYGKFLREMDETGSPHRAHEHLMATKAAEATRNEPPPPAKVFVRPGDCWNLDRHRLLCGDAMNASHVERLLCGRAPDLVVTSPPFNQSIEKFKPTGMYGATSWLAKVGRLAYPDSMPEPEYQESQRQLLASLHDVVRDGASVFYHHKIRYRDKEAISPLQWLPGPFKHHQTIILRRPGSITQNARMFLPCDERLYWLFKGDDFTFNDDTKNYSTIWDIGRETNKDHPVAFPVELPRRCILACSQVGETVYDPFAGSASTTIAAEMTDRTCFAMEIDPAFCGAAIERWQKHTKLEAVLESTGQTYAQVKQERLAADFNEAMIDGAPDIPERAA